MCLLISTLISHEILQLIWNRWLCEVHCKIGKKFPHLFSRLSDVISHKMPSNSSIGHSTAIKHSLSQPWAINNRRLIAQRRSGQNSKSDSWETGRFSSNFSQSNFLKMSDHSDQEVEPDFDSSRRFSKDSKHGREEVMAETSQGPGDPGVLRQVGSLRWTSTIIFSLL